MIDLNLNDLNYIIIGLLIFNLILMVFIINSGIRMLNLVKNILSEQVDEIKNRLKNHGV